MLYVPHLQYGGPVTELEVRTAGDPLAVAAALRRELAAADPNLSVVDVMPLRARVDASISAERLATSVAAVFGLLALGLASIGLHGVLSYAVTRRRAEIGIRMALGASRETFFGASCAKLLSSSAPASPSVCLRRSRAAD